MSHPVMDALRVVRDWLDDKLGVRRIKDVDSWSGSASRWDSTEAYCGDCLIDVNSAAGRDEKAQSHCKLPIREPGDGSDTYVRQAVYAAAGGRGITAVSKPADVSQDAWDSAVRSAANKLISAYNEMDEVAPDSVYEAAGKTPPERAVSVSAAMEVLWDEKNDWVMEEYAYIIDVFLDDDGVYAVIGRDGRLFRVQMFYQDGEISFSDEIEIEVQHAPVDRSVSVWRQANGVVRFMAISAVAVLNRSGELDSTSLFDSFVEHARESGEFPILNFFHLGEEYKIGQIDFVAREDWLYITSGIFDDDTPLARAVARDTLRDPEYWGHSIEFFGNGEYEEVADGVFIPVYREGVNPQIAQLPAKDAAHLFTGMVVADATQRRRLSMDKRTKAAMERLLDGEEDEEILAMFESVVDRVNENIEGSTMVRREAEETEDVEDVEDVEDAEVEIEAEVEVEDETEEVEDTEVDVEEDPEESVIEIDDDLVDVIAHRVMEQLQPTLDPIMNSLEQARSRIDEIGNTFDQAVTDLAERVNALEQPLEQRMQQELIDLPRQPTRVVYRPRTVIDDDGEQVPTEEHVNRTLKGIPNVR